MHDSVAHVTLWHRLDRFLALLRPHRQGLSLLIDGAVVALAWNATYLFRLGFERWWSARPGYDLWVMCGVVVGYLVAFMLFQVPRAMWRFAGFGEAKRLMGACAAAGVVAALVVMGLRLVQVPRAVLALHPVVSLMALVLVRMGYRMLYEHARKRITGSDAEIRRALVLGAGEAARLLLAGIHRQGWIVLGLLDDDPTKQQTRLSGLPVLGPLKAVQDAAVRGAATHLIVAMPSVSAARRQQVLDMAAATGLPVLTLPSAAELDSGDDVVQRLRDVEPQDVLGREPVQLDGSAVVACVRGATVCVTGAGGSIGSELCRQLASMAPRCLVLYELSEFNLYAIEQELSERHPGLRLVRLMGDVKDLPHLRRTLARHRPDLVFHAAAFKHVPLMEEDHNAWAALRNNTLGTWNVAQASAEAGVARFVLISTDKAVNPTNVMGATKRAAEMVVSAMAHAFSGTRFMAVRFGNVLGSSGSVIPKFKEQIAKGGPITVTHPDIVRYFMTIPEATRLVLQAAAIGESGQVLVLDMGEPVRIVDLARQLIRLSGRAEEDVKIEYSGLRAGEKLYEELLADSDTTMPTAVPRLRVARMDSKGEDLTQLLQWAAARDDATGDEVRAALAQVAAGYVPAATRAQQAAGAMP